MVSRLARAGGALLCVLATGCYQWVRVPVPQLAKLDHEREDPGRVRQSGHLITEDGDRVDVNDAVGVRVIAGSQTIELKQPIECTLTPDLIQIGALRATPMALARTDVQSAEVHVYQKWLSRSLWVAGFALAVTAFALVANHLLQNWGGVTPCPSTQCR